MTDVYMQRSASIGDMKIATGNAGELRQIAQSAADRLTTQQGVVVADDQNTLTVGERGPKFIAYNDAAMDLVAASGASGIASKLDAGCLKLEARKDIQDFVPSRGQLRFWTRE